MVHKFITRSEGAHTHRRRMLSRLLVGGALLFVLTTAAAAQSPSGSVYFETAESSSGMGDTLWTGCTLLFKGKMHGCTVSGLNVPTAGLARVSGMVFGLKKLESFAGTYTSAGDVFSMGG